MRDTALVVPSIREDSFRRFIDEWGPTGLFRNVDLILMEDNPTPTFDMDQSRWPLEDPDANHVHLSWTDIDRKEWSWIVPRRSDTVRSFAYWWAYDAGYKYLMTLDDDCYPQEPYEDLRNLHVQALDRTRWFNTLNNVRPRGTPYKNLGRRPVYINHGLWTNVLDYDAPQQLVDPVKETFTHDNRIIPSGAYFSFCGMNAIWRREAMVLSYHLLMGQAVDGVDVKGRWPDSKGYDPSLALKKLPFDRFGDIWCGIISKKICDHLGWAVSSGTPYIHHDRASDPFTNLRKEANGIQVNEWLWEKIDAVKLTSETPVYCYTEMGEAVAQIGGEHDEYWKRLGKAMVTWSDLFKS